MSVLIREKTQLSNARRMIEQRSKAPDVGQNICQIDRKAQWGKFQRVKLTDPQKRVREPNKNELMESFWIKTIHSHSLT